MLYWIREFFRELKRLTLGAWSAGCSADLPPETPFRRLPIVALLVSASMIGAGLYLGTRERIVQVGVAAVPEEPTVPEVSAPVVELPPPIRIDQPVRELLPKFPRGTRRPSFKEGTASVSIDGVGFDPDRDLVEVYDDRVWWESDNDDRTGDTEDDHLVHYALEESLRRVIELVVREGGTLEVHDAYRASGVHSLKSLHKQGRAVDLTCDELGLERLSILAWAAGFDWVYYEAPRRGGHHVHASVRPDRELYQPIMWPK
jgi:hypothetical protein